MMIYTTRCLYIIIPFLLFSCKGSQLTNNNNRVSINVLVFSKTVGFRHASIKDGHKAMDALSAYYNLQLTHSEDAAQFDDENLKQYDVVMFLSTTGDILNSDQQVAFETFINSGKGFVGIHAATDTEYNWPWYNGLVGAYFADHPPGIHQARVSKTIHRHSSTEHLPDIWNRTDEWYNFKSIDSTIIPILNLDETSYKGGAMGQAHPIAWYHEYDGGRSWYTAGGHTKASFEDALFMEHIVNGVFYAAGKSK